MAAAVSVEMVVAGDGARYPAESNFVHVHYVAAREDGEPFDSTRDRGRPFSFRIGEEQVITGLEEAVKQMSLGERVSATIPASLAYGSRGFPGKVPPNMGLVFDIELLSIQ